VKCAKRKKQKVSRAAKKKPKQNIMQQPIFLIKSNCLFLFFFLKFIHTKEKRQEKKEKMTNVCQDIFTNLNSNNLKQEYCLVECNIEELSVAPNFSVFILDENWYPAIIRIPETSHLGQRFDEEDDHDFMTKIYIFNFDSQESFAISREELGSLITARQSENKISVQDLSKCFLSPNNGDSWSTNYLHDILDLSFVDVETRIETKKLLSAFSAKDIFLFLVSNPPKFRQHWKKLVLFSDLLIENSGLGVSFWHSTKESGEKDQKIFSNFFIECIRLSINNFLGIDGILKKELLVCRRKILRHFLDLGFVVPETPCVQNVLGFGWPENCKDLYLEEVFFLLENSRIRVYDKESSVDRHQYSEVNKIIWAKYEALKKQKSEIVNELYHLLPRAIVDTILLPFLCAFQ
jgi:hypothetical protein